MTCPSSETVQIYQSQLQLLSGWLGGDDDVLEFEIVSAAARVGVDIDVLHFILPTGDEIPVDPHMGHMGHMGHDGHGGTMGGVAATACTLSLSPSQMWDEFLSHSIQPHSSKHYSGAPSNKAMQLKSCRKVTAHQFMRSVIKAAVEYNTLGGMVYYYIFVVIAAVALALMPLTHYWNDGPDISSARFYNRLIFDVSSSYIICQYFFNDFLFLGAIIVDSTRRYDIAVTLSKLIRPTFREMDAVVDLTWDKVSVATLARESSKNSKALAVAEAVTCTDEVLSKVMSARMINQIHPELAGLMSKRKVKDGMVDVEAGGNQDVSMSSQFHEFSVESGVQMRNRGMVSSEQKEGEESLPIDSAASRVKPSPGLSHPSLFGLLRACAIYTCAPAELFLAAIGTCVSGKARPIRTFPKLDFEVPQNVYAWMYSRFVLQSFGTRMLFRMQVYTGIRDSQ